MGSLAAYCLADNRWSRVATVVYAHRRPRRVSSALISRTVPGPRSQSTRKTSRSDSLRPG